MKYYIDTSIWRDYHENRSGNHKQLGRLAIRFFYKAIQENSILQFSDFVVVELSRKFSEAEIHRIFSIFYHLSILEYVKISRDKHFKKLTDICEFKQHI